MKGIVHIIEVLITGIILIMAFMFFFPQYSIKSKWSGVLLAMKTRDTINTIDRLGKTHEFATNTEKFKEFMNSTFLPEKVGTVMVWWKETKDLENYTEDMRVPYFTQGQKETIVDVTCEPFVDANTSALLHFNEGTGIAAYDETTNDNDGTLYNGSIICSNGDCPIWVNGKCKRAIKLDGIDDVVRIPNSPSINFTRNDNYTVEAWIKAGIQTGPSPNAGRAIVEKWEGPGAYPYVLRFNANPGASSPYFGIWNGTHGTQATAIGVSPLPGVWYHVAGVKDGNFLRIYVNGVLRGSQLITITGEIANNHNVYIGRRGDGDVPFNGVIDEVRISKVARKNFNLYDVYTFTLGLGYPY